MYYISKIIPKQIVIKIQLTEENYEKTIVNDDIGEEEKNNKNIK